MMTLNQWPLLIWTVSALSVVSYMIWTQRPLKRPILHYVNCWIVFLGTLVIATTLWELLA